MEPADLERLIDDALRRAPAPRAPATLVGRVMAAVAERRAPWYARPWSAWPRVWQAALAAAVVAIVSAIQFGWAAAAAWRVAVAGTTLSQSVLPAVVSARLDRILALADAVRIGWRVVAEPLVPVVIVAAFVMTAACACCAVALNRVALGGASQS